MIAPLKTHIDNLNSALAELNPAGEKELEGLIALTLDSPLGCF